MNSLLFRRQFILGPKIVDAFENWENFTIKKNLKLTYHPDLEFEYYNNGKYSLTLLGYLLNPYKKDFKNIDILKDIANDADNFQQVLNSTYELSGRWIIIYNSDQETKVINDLLGLREVYYHFEGDVAWCGTDPSILNEVLSLELSNDQELIKYYSSSYFKNRENAWYGNKTIFQNLFHLMPNHYLDLKNKKSVRYYTDNEFYGKYTLEEAVIESSKLLKGGLESANERYNNLMIAVTAGLDSRVLLAASRDISEDIYYFVSKMDLQANHMDIRIPSKLLPKLNLQLNILDNMSPLRKEIDEILSKNISLYRDNSRNIALQYYYDNLENKINVNGIVSEIGRFYYADYHQPKNEITAEYIMNVIGCPEEYTFVKKEIQIWLDEVKDFIEDYSIDLMSLFYWEQRMGNWGSLTRNEQDLALEGFMPFNNRKLLMITLSLDPEYRKGPDYIFYRKIMEYLWPEVLEEPINPISPKDKLRNEIISRIPLKFKNIMRNFLNKN